MNRTAAQERREAASGGVTAYHYECRRCGAYHGLERHWDCPDCGAAPADWASALVGVGVGN